MPDETYDRGTSGPRETLLGARMEEGDWGRCILKMHGRWGEGENVLLGHYCFIVNVVYLQYSFFLLACLSNIY